MRKAHTYHVKYRLHGIWEEERGIDVIAASAAEAYDKAFYEIIPNTEGKLPYSAWVYSVTYQNGNYRLLNNIEGKAY